MSMIRHKSIIVMTAEYNCFYTNGSIAEEGYYVHTQRKVRVG